MNQFEFIPYIVLFLRIDIDITHLLCQPVYPSSLFVYCICKICIVIDRCFMICVLCSPRFPVVSELAPIGTLVGTILAAAVNQTIFYSIVSGNKRGTACAPGHVPRSQ